MKTVFVPAILLSAVFMACSKSGTDKDMIDCSGEDKSFALHVNPVIQSFCNQPFCHTSGSVNGPGPLTNYTQVFQARSVIRNAVLTGLMPQNATLTTSQKNAIICWIDSGAPNN